MICNPIQIESLKRLHKGIFLNSFPNDKILGKSKVKAFENYKRKSDLKLKSGLGRVNSIVGKGENAAY